MGGCLHGFYQLIDLSTSLSLYLCYSLSLSVSLQRKYKVTSLSRSPSLLSSFCFAIIYLYFNPAPPLLVPVSISPALFFCSFFFFFLPSSLCPSPCFSTTAKAYITAVKPSGVPGRDWVWCWNGVMVRGCCVSGGHVRPSWRQFVSVWVCVWDWG